MWYHTGLIYQTGRPKFTSTTSSSWRLFRNQMDLALKSFFLTFSIIDTNQISVFILKYKIFLYNWIEFFYIKFIFISFKFSDVEFITYMHFKLVRVLVFVFCIISISTPRWLQCIWDTFCRVLYEAEFSAWRKLFVCFVAMEYNALL